MSTLSETRFKRSGVWFPVAIALLAPFLIYFDTLMSMVATWNSSETFAHGYIIFPISLWLVWKRRAVLACMSPAPFWPAVFLLACVGFGWLLAELAKVQVAQQYMFVAMIPLMTLALLGPKFASAIAFPLFFLLLSVPFGEIFIQPLITFTAHFTVAALQATGIPVLQDGNSFVVPSGSWSVVEACSGIRYLIASVTLGCLYAYLTYRSRAKQAVFIALSIIVPILANGMRAYMIVMIGHLSGMTLAVGVDHLIYGWVFFGLVMLLMFWIGSFWREDDEEPPHATSHSDYREKPSATPDGGRIFAAACAVIVSAAVWPAFKHYLEYAGNNPATASLQSFRPAWTEARAFTSWKPHFFPANAELYKTFRQGAQSVGVAIHYYRNQNRNSMLISSSNQLVSESDEQWRRLETTVRTENVGDLSLPVRETRIEGSSGRLVAWTWYWIDEQFMVNDYLGKLLQAKEKLLLRGDDGASITVFAAYGENPDEARDAIRHFIADSMPAIQHTLNANKGL